MKFKVGDWVRIGFTSGVIAEINETVAIVKCEDGSEWPVWPESLIELNEEVNASVTMGAVEESE